LLRLGSLGCVNLIKDGGAAAGEKFLRGLVSQLLRVRAIQRFAQE
jgi:hypothetical protein